MIKSALEILIVALSTHAVTQQYMAHMVTRIVFIHSAQGIANIGTTNNTNCQYWNYKQYKLTILVLQTIHTGNIGTTNNTHWQYWYYK